jgi:Arc/MetJ-type ribon-helix-helix transcriptional regulator
MSHQIAIRLSDRAVAELDDAIARGRFPNRAAALREGLGRVLADEREREIEEAYRRGYGGQPQEEWVGEVGLAAFAALVEAEEPDAEPL